MIIKLGNIKKFPKIKAKGIFAYSKQWHDAFDNLTWSDFYYEKIGNKFNIHHYYNCTDQYSFTKGTICTLYLDDTDEQVLARINDFVPDLQEIFIQIYEKYHDN